MNWAWTFVLIVGVLAALVFLHDLARWMKLVEADKRLRKSEVDAGRDPDKIHRRGRGRGHNKGRRS